MAQQPPERLPTTPQGVSQPVERRTDRANTPRPTQARHLNVGVGLVIHGTKALFVRRISPRVPEYNYNWELPGGKIEAFESLQQAISREVAEETGYSVSTVEILPFEYPADLTLLEPPLQVSVKCARCTLRANDSTRATSYPQPTVTGSHEFAWIEFKDIPYDKVVPGSREFVLWAAHHAGHPIPPGASFYRLDLELDLSSHGARRYEIALTYEPEIAPYQSTNCVNQHSPEPFVVRTVFSRKQADERVHSKRYATMSGALRQAKRLVRQRKRQGYKIVALQSNHPLRSWVVSLGIKSDEPIYPPLFPAQLAQPSRPYTRK